MDLHELHELVQVCESRAFQTIVAELTESIEALAVQMEQSSNSQLDLSLIGEWKATRKIVRSLANKRDEYRSMLDAYMEQHPEVRGHVTANRMDGITVR